MTPADRAEIDLMLEDIKRARERLDALPDLGDIELRQVIDAFAEPLTPLVARLGHRTSREFYAGQVKRLLVEGPIYDRSAKRGRHDR
jgi:hypothetical protein